MANLNKVLLIGRLTRDPELRYTPSGAAVADFGLAVNRQYRSQDGAQQEETTFVDVTAWGKQAELARQYLGKGRQVFIEGRLKYDQWTTPDGQKRSKVGVTIENIQFLDSRGGQQGQGGDQGFGGQPDSRGGQGYGPQGGGSPSNYGSRGGDYQDAGGGPPSDGPEDVPF